ncbi:MAG: Crp/Fnr family transcriptional regulator [Bacteroidia bacterium]|nr:Crp/Fnr family transcriptional regulator [Bacteroidia bacterium]MBT8268323.1 Crp/Fnr family transcriptional regulator [Bacteroidia bacterium]NNK69017.1 Crp/Fnr family transcriptional regulator [Flavobacteriaceae bacterium]
MKELLKRYIEFSNEEYETFISMAKLHSFNRNEFLLQAGHSVNKLFFIKKGIARGYRLLNGVDVTHHFYLENWFATDFESYLTGAEGELYLEALSSMECYEFNKDDLLSWFERYPKFEKLRYVQAEDAYLQMVNRYKDFQSKDLKERYIQLIIKNPQLFNLVPQKYIASYLGARPQSLSRIKESIKSLNS